MGLLPATVRESLLPLELEEALEQRRPVRMEYLDGRQNRTQRVIQPMHVRRSNGELLLVAHCHLRGEQRTFKIERIVQLIRLESPPEPNRVESRHEQEIQSPPPGSTRDSTWEQLPFEPGPDRPAEVDS
jgi:predicted DNA-binding transcriptional regulator YafY